VLLSFCQKATYARAHTRACLPQLIALCSSKKRCSMNAAAHSCLVSYHSTGPAAEALLSERQACSTAQHAAGAAVVPPPSCRHDAVHALPLCASAGAPLPCHNQFPPLTYIMAAVRPAIAGRAKEAQMIDHNRQSCHRFNAPRLPMCTQAIAPQRTTNAACPPIGAAPSAAPSCTCVAAQRQRGLLMHSCARVTIQYRCRDDPWAETARGRAREWTSSETHNYDK
jgi:hypothetical protein